MKKQSSIEWLFDEIFNIPFNTPEAEDLYSEIMDLKEKYKQLHKQEIIEAYEEGQETPYEYSEDNDVNYYDGRNYYKNTYEKEN